MNVLLSRRLVSSVSVCRRHLSTRLDPPLAALAHRLAQTHPCLPVAGDKVRVLHTPTAFYDTLLNMIRRAQSRIFLSSLYMGTGTEELFSSLRDALARNNSLEVRIHLDLLRSTRPGDLTSVRTLAALSRDFPGRARVFLFKSPKLKGPLAKLVPRRFDEGWGTWHSKIYGVDDEVLLSGANLSTSYFSDRQDRYIHIGGARSLAQYCLAFLRVFELFSFVLRPSPASDGYETAWVHHTSHPQSFESALRTALLELQASQRQGINRDDQVADTLLVPAVQCGYLGIRHEEELMDALFHHVGATNSDVDLTSGYFGLYRPYQDLIVRSPSNCRIVAASPLANGFYGSAGISGHIPDGYTLLEQRFWSRVQQAGRAWTDGNGVRLSEWGRPGWTYHAKGLWLTPRTAETPNTTVFGSTNLSSRSANLDTELSFAVLTANDNLRQQLRTELDAIRQYSDDVDERTWSTPSRRVRFSTRLLVALLQNML